MKALIIRLLLQIVEMGQGGGGEETIRRGRLSLPWRPGHETKTGEMLPPDYRSSRASSRNTYDDSL